MKEMALKKPARILFLLDHPSQDKHRHQYLLEGLLEAGISPVIGYFCGNARDSSMAKGEIRAVSLGLSRARFKGFRPSTVYTLKRLISSNHISVIHCQRHRATVNACLAMAGTRAHSLFYTVGSTNVLRNWNRRLVFNFIARKITRVTCVSAAVRDYMLKNSFMLTREKTVVIRNGVDIKKFDLEIPQREARNWLGIPEKGFCFGIVARLKKAKCHDTLLRAFSRLLHQAPDTRLAIVGDGPLEGRLKRLCNELQIADKVHFIGRIEHKDVPLALRAFDCFVHPSFREGLSMAILEAMASGLPVITTNADGVREIFDTNLKIGDMVRPMDQDALFASMLEFRTMSPEQLMDMGENARKHVKENFTRQAMVKAYVRLYQQALSPGSEKGGSLP